MIDKENFLAALKSDKAVFEKMLMESAIAGKIQLIDQCIFTLESGSFDFKVKSEDEIEMIDKELSDYISESSKKRIDDNLKKQSEKMPEEIRKLSEDLKNSIQEEHSKNLGEALKKQSVELANALSRRSSKKVKKSK